MAKIEFDAPGYHVEVTSGAAVNPSGRPWLDFIDALARVDATLDPISLDVVATTPVGDWTYALVAAGSRTYSATLRLTARQRKVTGTSFWTVEHLLLHNPLVESVLALLEISATKIEVDWT